LAKKIYVQFQKLPSDTRVYEQTQKGIKKRIQGAFKIDVIQNTESFSIRIIIKLPSTSTKITNPRDVIHFSNFDNGNKLSQLRAISKKKFKFC